MHRMMKYRLLVELNEKFEKLSPQTESEIGYSCWIYLAKRDVEIALVCQPSFQCMQSTTLLNELFIFLKKLIFENDIKHEPICRRIDSCVTIEFRNDDDDGDVDGDDDIAVYRGDDINATEDDDAALPAALFTDNSCDAGTADDDWFVDVDDELLLFDDEDGERIFNAIAAIDIAASCCEKLKFW